MLVGRWRRIGVSLFGFAVLVGCGGGGGGEGGLGVPDEAPGDVADAYSRLPVGLRDTDGSAFYRQSNVSSLLSGPGVFNRGFDGLFRQVPVELTLAEESDEIRVLPYAYPVFGNATFGVAESRSSEILCSVALAGFTETLDTGEVRPPKGVRMPVLGSYGVSAPIESGPFPTAESACISPGERVYFTIPSDLAEEGQVRRIAIDRVEHESGRLIDVGFTVTSFDMGPLRSSGNRSARLVVDVHNQGTVDLVGSSSGIGNSRLQLVLLDRNGFPLQLLSNDTILNGPLLTEPLRAGERARWVVDDFFSATSTIGTGAFGFVNDTVSSVRFVLDPPVAPVDAAVF